MQPYGRVKCFKDWGGKTPTNKQGGAWWEDEQTPYKRGSINQKVKKMIQQELEEMELDY